MYINIKIFRFNFCITICQSRYDLQGSNAWNCFCIFGIEIEFINFKFSKFLRKNRDNSLRTVLFVS